MLDVQEIERNFKARLKVLGAKVDEIEVDLREPSDPDFAEHATEAEGDEVLEGLEGTALMEIAQINAALGRIEDGVYGECATCGDPVGEKRLAVIPHASQCIACASK